MKRVVCLLLSVLFFSLCYAQQKVARVTLKSGVSITGTVTELNPVSHLVIQVAGNSTRIEMSDVSSIEDVAQDNDIILPISDENDQTKVFLERENYPESYTLDVGPYKLDLVLIQGGLFDMGYDGRGSLAMKSEPVHKVQLSSFFVNKAALSKDMVSYIKNGTENHNAKVHIYSPSSSKDALGIAENLSNITNFPFRLISEAQCEYVLTTGLFEKLVLNKSEVIYCSDYFSEYTKSSKPQVDPVGPNNGKYRVIRVFSAKDTYAYSRFNSRDYMKCDAIRISIPASVLVPQ